MDRVNPDFVKEYIEQAQSECKVVDYATAADACAVLRRFILANHQQCVDLELEDSSIEKCLDDAVYHLLFAADDLRRAGNM